MSEKWLLLGASKGLGKSFLDLAKENSSHELIPMSRQGEVSADFSKSENFPKIAETVASFQADRLFYFAGGGPYGNFQDKAWKDHQWALNVNFVFPSFLLHHLMSRSKASCPKQIVFVGSAIAESSADPRAAMYSASKHALKGLIDSVRAELKDQPEAFANLDLRLFSPGYMDTGLLPQHAWPRQQAGLVVSPDKVAEMLWAWIHNADDASSHFVLNSPP